MYQDVPPLSVPVGMVLKPAVGEEHHDEDQEPDHHHRNGCKIVHQVIVA